VAFIGISNWALDPAKMNRGILLSRGVPDKDDLIRSAQGICAGNEDAHRLMRHAIRVLAEGYHEVYMEQEREYFGLRDFYSLVKMVYANVCRNVNEPTRLRIHNSSFFSNF
jgi:E3 ubiquitin-protein ligase RNF213